MPTKPVADQPSMKGYDPDLGMGANVPTSIKKAITKAVGTKRVMRKAKTAAPQRTNLVRLPIAGAQGNANSTPMMAAAKRLIGKTS